MPGNELKRDVDYWHPAYPIIYICILEVSLKGFQKFILFLVTYPLYYFNFRFQIVEFVHKANRAVT